MEYMSQEGYDKLVAELKELEAQVPKVKDAIAEARAMGDLSIMLQSANRANS